MFLYQGKSEKFKIIRIDATVICNVSIEKATINIQLLLFGSSIVVFILSNYNCAQWYIENLVFYIPILKNKFGEYKVKIRPISGSYIF